jgi:hypothetical protein
MIVGQLSFFVTVSAPFGQRTRIDSIVVSLGIAALTLGLD